MTTLKYIDRVSGSPIEQKLEQKFENSDHQGIRYKLFLYLERYNESYHFVLLENAFALLAKSLASNTPLSPREQLLVHEEIENGKYEYFISLNHISEALAIIHHNQTIDLSMAKEIINHVWEAYSCNEEEFISRECTYLTENL